MLDRININKNWFYIQVNSKNIVELYNWYYFITIFYSLIRCFVLVFDLQIQVLFNFLKRGFISHIVFDYVPRNTLISYLIQKKGSVFFLNLHGFLDITCAKLYIDWINIIYMYLKQINKWNLFETKQKKL